MFYAARNIAFAKETDQAANENSNSKITKTSSGDRDSAQDKREKAALKQPEHEQRPNSEQRLSRSNHMLKWSFRVLTSLRCRHRS